MFPQQPIACGGAFQTEIVEDDQVAVGGGLGCPSSIPGRAQIEGFLEGGQGVFRGDCFGPPVGVDLGAVRHGVFCSASVI